MPSPALAVVPDADPDELEYAALRAWAAEARDRRIDRGFTRARKRAARRRRLIRMIVVVVFVVLGYLAYVRFGADPLMAVQPR